MIRGADDGKNIVVSDYKEEDLDEIFKKFFEWIKFIFQNWILLHHEKNEINFSFTYNFESKIVYWLNLK